MARRTRIIRSTPAPDKALFEDSIWPSRARRRPHKSLFLPQCLRDAARNRALEGEAQDRAFEIAKKWAKLERDGHLPEYLETSVDSTFLSELFGDGLGYRLKTASPSAFELDVRFSVPGVGIADGALGNFPLADGPTAIIELKGATVDLDRDKSNGRTAVQQCWDYLNGLPDCPWGIVSNFSLIRLYHRSRSSQAYEEFALQELAHQARFREFYYVFEKSGLLQPGLARVTRADALLQQTASRERQVGDELYLSYQRWRNQLIAHLHGTLGRSLDVSIRAAQKLLDRVIFIAFCEQRALLPADSLKRAWEQAAGFSKVTNPRWHNFLALFQQVDKGGRDIGLDVGYNGGLFSHDPEVDELELDDEPWAQAFKGFGDWNFRDEVNVDVLGHLFERSITELEKLRVGGLFAIAGGDDQQKSAMAKSPQRKRFGIYYTPPAFTGLIVERTLDAMVAETWAAIASPLGITDPETGLDRNGRSSAEYWTACIDALRDLKIVDPACGSGAFLIRALEAMERHYRWAFEGLIEAGARRPDELSALEELASAWILNDNLHGVDLSAEAVEITKLALWIRTARKGRSLANLSRNIVCGNSLIADEKVDQKAFDWRARFPQVFGRPGPRAGFDVVIGNPPWERMKVQDREFFSLTDPKTARAVNASERKKRIAAMPTENPELYKAYLQAQETARRAFEYARSCGHFPLTGKGDINTYMLFAELAQSLAAPTGIVGLLVPSGIATDESTKEFFGGLMTSQRLVSLYDFENRAPVFADVDSRMKFSVLVFGGSARTAAKADFVFFAHTIEDVSPRHRERHIPLSEDDLKAFNPNTRTCPVFRTRRDMGLTRAIYDRVRILVDETRERDANPWGIRFHTMFHQTNDAHEFKTAEEWKKRGYRLDGNIFVKGTKRALPLYEAKMVQAYDHRAASVVVDEGNLVRQGQKEETSNVGHQNPEYTVLPRWWVPDGLVRASLGDGVRPALLAFKDITSATNQRTMIAAFLPVVGAVNSAPLLLIDPTLDPRLACCLLGNLNSLVYDFVARQKVGAVHLNFFVVKQIPAFPPDGYRERCPWSPRQTLQDWISERVLRLSCTSNDMKPLADACGFKGSRGDGVHAWRDAERDELLAELDAAFARLYGVDEADFAYLLESFQGMTSSRRDALLDAFRALK